jgi:hypothetical protein
MKKQAQARLLKAIAGLHKQYDPKERMLQIPFSTPGYHTALKGGMVHPIRQSLDYAVNLLDTEKPEFIERAIAILTRIVALQDSDPASPTFGIWSWFLEEPLPQMRPPDFNWADFCGVQLLQVSRDHKGKLPTELAKGVDAAIVNACKAIIKRNVGPSYTNIAIMGTYVTLIAGELLGQPELRTYGLARLERFAQYTQDNGTFEEYNSPTYTIVALAELSRIKAHARDPKAQALIDPLVRKAWEELATHFHAPTRQWAGPHSRAYSSLLAKRTLAIIQRGTAGRINFGVDEPDREEIRLPLVCPPDLELLFGPLTQPRTVTETFIKRSKTVGTTYLHPDYALATISEGDLWNQRRALLLYFGDAKTPGYAHLRFLKNGYDFSSAILTAQQREGLALGTVTFITNGGDTHISLDKVKNATIKAKDLRLRLELGGPAAKKIPLVDKDNKLVIDTGAIKVHFTPAVAKLGALEGKLAIGGDSAAAAPFWLDIVFYAGEEREFNLAALDQAVIGFSLSVGEHGAVQAEQKEGSLRLACDGLSITVPTKPGPRK